MATGLLQLKLTLVDAKPRFGAAFWWTIASPSNVCTSSFRRSRAGRTGTCTSSPSSKDAMGIRLSRDCPGGNDALPRLHSLPLSKEAHFSYVYDFGDRWEIEIKVEQVLPPDTRAPVASVIEGARAFPPEDSGGVAGYEDLLAILSDPTDPDYEEPGFG